MHAVNYYERHIGDYAKAANHLSMLEDGAYTRLLDRYYATEMGIPATEVYRVTRARSKEERGAVEVVLREFFHLVDEVWIKNRCEEEIVSARRRIDSARENGSKGGRPSKNTTQNQSKPSGFSPDIPIETDQKPTGFQSGSVLETGLKALQSPSPSLQSPSTNPREGERARGVRLPAHWELTADRRGVAEAESLDAERTFGKFTAYWEAASGRSATKRNWDAAWRFWCRTEADRKPNGYGGNGGHPPTAPLAKSPIELANEALERAVLDGKTDRQILTELAEHGIDAAWISGKREEMANVQH